MAKKVVPNFPERNVISDDRSLISRPWAIWLRSLVDAVQANYNATIGAILHNSLPDLQGGAPDDYNHLTGAEKEQALTPTTIPDHDDLEGIQGEGYNHLSDEQVAAIGGGGGGGVETTSFALSDKRAPAVPTIPFYTAYVHCGSTIVVDSMCAYCTDTKGLALNVQLGVYSSDNVRLGYGNVALSVVGLIAVTLDSEVTLVGGELYYFTILCTDPSAFHPYFLANNLSIAVGLRMYWWGNSAITLPSIETGYTDNIQSYYIGAYKA